MLTSEFHACFHVAYFKTSSFINFQEENSVLAHNLYKTARLKEVCRLSAEGLLLNQVKMNLLFHCCCCSLQFSVFPYFFFLWAMAWKNRYLNLKRKENWGIFQTNISELRIPCLTCAGNSKIMQMKSGIHIFPISFSYFNLEWTSD